RRLEAEALHDSLLALPGRLDARAGGPADSDPSSPRRLIYLAVSRSGRSDFGTLFDRADAALHVERRTASTAAPQALLLMNDARVMDLALALADRPEVAAEDDPGRRVARLYRLVLGRPASEDEIALGRDFVAAAMRESPPTGEKTAATEKGAAGLPPWAQYAQALLLSNEFLFVD
ncbi:MAG TPA: DUF1553 domain-containing protein, partial [Isosphaeraceae bacterium]|nr:DUF1553 domain-containing protein [Isosphaeraceae bacterium]